MNKLKSLIEGLPLEELQLLELDYKAGNIEKLINNKLKAFNEGGNKICPVCHAETSIDDGYALTFGPKGFRKKAVFCATDCLEYFLSKMRKQQNGTS
ncbi:hypothetical protein C0585_04120 [Candidatus Woesearchaeota archaeon]|nr:MAG: hypothetical protein C0585_04120 [Candidatus Woesearchaeota archaeon]